MKVLSLFDWISVGQYVLNELSIPVEEYYASEIEKSSIKTTLKNFPNTINMGDILNVRYENGILYNKETKYNTWKIDLLIWGSPCTWFSVAWKWLNFDDPQSKLFFEYVRLLKEIKPTYFFLENVKMKKEWADIITMELWVEPIIINSEIFSAQSRKRTYWTNIKIDKKELSIHMNNPSKLTMNNILQTNVDSSLYFSKEHLQILINKEIENWKELPFNETNIYNYIIPCTTPKRINKRWNWRRFKPDSSVFYTLTTIDRHGVIQEWKLRLISENEGELLQWLPIWYTTWTYNSRMKSLWNAWQADTIKFIFKNLKIIWQN